MLLHAERIQHLQTSLQASGVSFLHRRTEEMETDRSVFTTWQEIVPHTLKWSHLLMVWTVVAWITFLKVTRRLMREIKRENCSPADKDLRLDIYTSTQLVRKKLIYWYPHIPFFIPVEYHVNCLKVEQIQKCWSQVPYSSFHCYIYTYNLWKRWIGVVLVTDGAKYFPYVCRKSLYCFQRSCPLHNRLSIYPLVPVPLMRSGLSD